MTRKELEEYIYKTYKVRPDSPWKPECSAMRITINGLLLQ